MGSISDRLRLWSEVANQSRAEEDPEVLGGRRAEEFVASLIATHVNFRGAFAFGGKRIPSEPLRRRREFDLIVCTPKMIHLIEVKNWSGTLYDHGATWSQHRKNGEIVEHANLLVDNRERRDVLVEFLGRRGVEIPHAFATHHVCQKVFFIGERLRLDRSILEHPDVITGSKLRNYLDSQRGISFAEGLVCSLIEFCFHSELAGVLQRGLYGNMPAPTFRSVVSQVADTSTWDRVFLFGTKVLNGDLIELRLGSSTFGRHSLKSASTIRFHWTRGKLAGLAKAITGIGSIGRVDLGTRTEDVGSDGSLYFHCAGDQHPQSRSILDIERIELG